MSHSLSHSKWLCKYHIILVVPHFFTTFYVTQRRSASGAEESIMFTSWNIIRFFAYYRRLRMTVITIISIFTYIIK